MRSDFMTETRCDFRGVHSEVLCLPLCVKSMLSVLMNDHRSTARAHVQPQAAAARILLRACAASLSAKSGRDKPTCAIAAPCCSGGVQHLKKSSTEPTAATGGLQSSPWRCGLSAAEALSSNSRFQDASSSPHFGGV